MPAAAVIPALIAYIKVVAVKKLVVGFWNGEDLVLLPSNGGKYWSSRSLLLVARSCS